MIQEGAGPFFFLENVCAAGHTRYLTKNVIVRAIQGMASVTLGEYLGNENDFT